MITASEPTKALVSRVSYKAGRSRGTVSVRHKGGRVKRLYRHIDFKGEDKLSVPGVIASIEYDPYRFARIALVHYKDGDRRYILATTGMTPGSEVVTSREKLPIAEGMRMPLEFIPAGTIVHNIQLQPGGKGSMVRGAGTGARVMSLQGNFVQVKLPSSEVRLMHKQCLASVGQVSNPEHGNITWGKAGRMRKRGIRPSVRGVAMSPYAHPHGGGEGRTGEGRRAKTPWGKPARGVKTRKRKKYSNVFIVSKRTRKRKT